MNDVKVDSADLAVVLKQAEGELPAVTLGYGLFARSILDFLIIAAAIFVAIRIMNSLKRKQAEVPAEEPPTQSNEELLLIEIRDLLKQRTLPSRIGVASRPAGSPTSWTPANLLPGSCCAERSGRAAVPPGRHRYEAAPVSTFPDHDHPDCPGQCIRAHGSHMSET